MGYCVYILACAEGSYYVGSANDLRKRLADHAKGNVAFTSSRLPVRLVYTEEYATLSNARRRERQIKGWKKRKAIERLIKR